MLATSRGIVLADKRLGRVPRISRHVAEWSALADDFRTFLLGALDPPRREPASPNNVAVLPNEMSLPGSITKTLHQQDRSVRTWLRSSRYSRPTMNTLQHVGAFVVQFRSESVLEGKPLAGRIEHVTSGRTATFHSLEALMEALDRVINEVRSSVSGESSGALDAELK